MLLKSFCIYDAKAAAYLQPMFFKSTPEAIRAFGDACNDEKSAFHMHAEDYTLFEIGTYDDEKAEFTSLKVPFSILSASEASRKHQNYYATFALKDVSAVS